MEKRSLTGQARDQFRKLLDQEDMTFVEFHAKVVAYMIERGDDDEKLFALAIFNGLSGLLHSLILGE